MSGRIRRPERAGALPGSRIEAAFRRTRSGIAVLDESGVVADASAGFVALLGANQTLLDGASVFDIVHPDDRPLVAALLRVAEADAVIRFGPPGLDVTCAVTTDNLVGDPDVRGIVLTVRRLPGAGERDEFVLARDAPAFLVDGHAAYAYRVESPQDGGRIFTSPRLRELAGYADIEIDRLAAGWLTVIHPDDRVRFAEEDARTDRAAESFDLSYRIVRRDGAMRRVRDRAFPVSDSEGRVVAWTGVLTDVTGDGELESDPGDRGDRAQSILDRLPVAVYEYVIGPDDHESGSFINRRMGDLLGYGGAEWEPTWDLWDELLHPADRDAVIAEMRRCGASGEPFRMEYRMIARDGRIVWLRDQAERTRLLPNGRQVWHGAMTDITEEVASREALAASEARFANFLDRIPVQAMLTDSAGRYVWANEQVRRWYGIDPRSLVGTTVHDWQPESVAFAVNQRNRTVLETGEPAESEEHVVAIDGSELNLLSIAFPLVGADNEPLVGVVSVDVAGQRRAADAERMLAAMVDSVEEAIVMRSLDGTILSWNPGAERLYGYVAREMVGTPVDRLVPEEFDAEMAAANDRIRRGERVGPIETQRLHKDGRAIDISYTLAPVRDESGAVVGTVAVARDHSEPRRVREELRRANEELERRVVERTSQLSVVNARLTQNLTELERTQEALRHRVGAFRQQAQLLDLANDAIVVTNLAGTTLFWNSAAESLYGWSGEHARTESAQSLLDPVYPEPIEAIMAHLERHGHWQGEIDHRRQDGIRIVVESRWALQRDERGLPASILTINRDVTERTRIERERAHLAQAARSHARRVEELAQLKDDFTAIVAHELVSPVAAIRWFAEVLAMEDLTIGEREHALATIRAETDLLHVLVDDVRAIAKVDRDDFSVSLRPVDVRMIVDAAAAYARSLFGDHPFTVEGQTDGRVLADPARIGQVLRNLLGNAAKYTPPGTPIALRVHLRSERVRIEVADQGPGINLDDAPVIFEKYRRGRQEGSRHVSGAGIGLYVGKRIAQAHGGDLTLSGRPGAGSVFGFELDRVD